MRYIKYIITLIGIVSALMLISCDKQAAIEATPLGYNTPPLIITNTPDNTPIVQQEHTPLTIYKPGYNSYGIPSEYMWRLYDDNGNVKDNIDEIVIDIKNELGIPQCITGIPFDKKAEDMLIDNSGQPVSNWEEIIEQLKSEWLSE